MAFLIDYQAGGGGGGDWEDTYHNFLIGQSVLSISRVSFVLLYVTKLDQPKVIA